MMFHPLPDGNRLNPTHHFDEAADNGLEEQFPKLRRGNGGVTANKSLHVCISLFKSI